MLSLQGDDPSNTTVRGPAGGLTRIAGWSGPEARVPGGFVAAHFTVEHHW